MVKREGPRGAYEKWTTAVCVWCAEPFEVCHQDARTCSQRCRSRLARFRKLVGFEPDEPPGNVTTQTAYQLLVKELLRLEKIRRDNYKILQSVEWHKRGALERELDAELEQRRRTGR